MPQKLTKVMRLDSMPLQQTYYTVEGYLHDRPILTCTGIFEYTNPDGTKRRELRIPEEVFDPESLKSYRGKPVVITHDAGQIDKNNVHRNQIGTILSDGYQTGDDVRAEIMIHATDEMKRTGYKELSLGYNLDLDETPGTWNGQPYDAVQRNIRINHLALVLDARAGKQARLNIDSRKAQTIIKNVGGTQTMGKRNRRRMDGAMSSEELAKALADYKSRKENGTKEDADETEKKVPAIPEAPVAPEKPTPEEQVAEVVKNRDRRDEAGDPESMEEAMGQIAEMDSDNQTLMDIIDALLAEKDFAKDAEDKKGKNPFEDVELPEDEEADADDEEEEFPEDEEVDADDDPIPSTTDTEMENEDSDDDPIPDTTTKDLDKKTPTEPIINQDSIDRIVRQRGELRDVAQLLNMDGIDRMDMQTAKKAVIATVRPGMRLDGKSNTYINAAYDFAVEEVRRNSRKDTSYQKRQMVNKNTRADSRENADSANAARQRMIKRQYKKNV